MNRRGFLKFIGVAPAGAAVLAATPAAEAVARALPKKPLTVACEHIWGRMVVDPPYYPGVDDYYNYGIAMKYSLEELERLAVDQLHHTMVAETLGDPCHIHTDHQRRISYLAVHARCLKCGEAAAFASTGPRVLP